MAEEMEMMLKEYAQSSDLSEETKNEDIGELILYTRSDLERMQARDLKDIMKLLPVFGYMENRYANADIFPTAMMPVNSSLIRIFIDDQEVASGLNSSGYGLLGNIDLDFVDHIEIYHSETSYRYTAESTFIVIRLYSKSAERDEGGALSLRYGSRGTNQENIAYAQRSEAFSYYAYGAHVQEDRKSVKGDLGADLEQDKENSHLFATLQSDTDTLQLHYLKRDQDALAGLSPTLTPLDSDSETTYFHAGYQKQITDDLSLMVNYDKSEYELDHLDILPLKVLPRAPFNLYDAQYKTEDQVISAELQHQYGFGDHTLLSGIKYRNNQFGMETVMGGVRLPQKEFDEQHLFTMFLEDQYSYSDDLMLIVGLKYTDIHNNGGVDDVDYLSGRFALRYAMPIGISKFSLSVDTVPVMPSARIDPLFMATKIDDQKLISMAYSFNKKTSSSDSTLLIRYVSMKEFTMMSPEATMESYDRSVNALALYLNSKYKFDVDHELQSSFHYYYMDNMPIGDIAIVSATLRLFDRWGDIQVFNELFMRQSLKDTDEGKSFDYSAGIQYQASEALSFALKGENIFNDSRLNTALRSIDPVTAEVKTTPFQTIQQTFLVQVKYLF